MPQSLARLLVHLVFSTKNRIAFLQAPELRAEVHAYLTATLQGQDCEPVQVGGVADHVHLLFGLSRTISLADLVKNLKTSSTKMMREKGHGFQLANRIRRVLGQRIEQERRDSLYHRSGNASSEDDIPRGNQDTSQEAQHAF
jgi:REP element-mobilizing transposase RayT